MSATLLGVLQVVGAFLGGLLMRLGVVLLVVVAFLVPVALAHRVKVGIDGVVQEILPWALSVDLPRPGQELAEGEVAAIISCGSDEARIAAPIAGRVVAVNAEVARDPSLVKEDGYGRGWLFAIEPIDARWSTLPAGEVAREWMTQESDRLDQFLESRLGFAGKAARSGPAPQILPPGEWRELTRSFLHA